MSNLIRVKRGLESNRSGQTPAEGELLYTTDEKKLYIGDGSTAGGIPVGSGSISNNLFALESSVDFTSGGAQSLGTLPANADVLRSTLIVSTPSNTTTEVTIGDATNGAASYMSASENDPEISGIYIADKFVSNGGSNVTINATITTPGSTGAGIGIIEYRLTSI